ncbi:MAG: HTTM domain-containing protein [Oligoflexales bacterium]|nr:HTTM domain-containing protein [Oligoflexales bacterium]
MSQRPSTNESPSGSSTLELKSLLGCYYRFLSTPISPFPMSTFRILFGMILILNALFLYPDLDAWFSDTGVLPTNIAAQVNAQTRISLFWIFGSSLSTVNIVFGCYIIAAFCLCFGFCSRVAAVITWITLVSFHHRNIYILHAGDTLMRLLSFFMIFADSAAVMSIDRLVRIYRGKETSATYRQINPLPMRLIQMQFCIVYFSTFTLKTLGDTWIDGSAVFIVQQLEQFERFPLPVFMKSLLTSKLLSWYTLLVEGTFPFLIWFKETRLIMISALLILHLGLEYSMNIQLFQILMCSVFVVFLTEKEICGAALFLHSKLSHLKTLHLKRALPLFRIFP